MNRTIYSRFVYFVCICALIAFVEFIIAISGASHSLIFSTAHFYCGIFSFFFFHANGSYSILFAKSQVPSQYIIIECSFAFAVESDCVWLLNSRWWAAHVGSNVQEFLLSVCPPLLVITSSRWETISTKRLFSVSIKCPSHAANAS